MKKVYKVLHGWSQSQNEYEICHG
ncbi:unnamed protein product [Cuscuta epithymum]|uniref:Uncharacterized protein n=1 Tax=Cuscuta epithymum TaxID=186058 RepID=A0AAV0E167_9ASTE|nr:unnamed protein product [Cuscuta epithymum]